MSYSKTLSLGDGRMATVSLKKPWSQHTEVERQRIIAWCEQTPPTLKVN